MLALPLICTEVNPQGKQGLGLALRLSRDALESLMGLLRDVCLRGVIIYYADNCRPWCFVL